MTVYKALKVLNVEGLVYGVQGSGFYVSSPTNAGAQRDITREEFNALVARVAELEAALAGF